jgi:endonuclease III
MFPYATVFQRFQAHNPKPETELIFHNPFTTLVAVVLSAQATDVGVNKATEALFKIADTPEKMVDLGLDGLKAHIKTVNYYPTKAKHIMALSQMLIDKHHGQVPSTREELEQLPGVGRKTANVVLNVAFGQPTMAVDTHIFRVSNRLGLAPGKTPREVEDKLLQVVPKEYMHHAHHWLILHGRYICKARRPECERCFLTDVCGYYKDAQK